MKTSFKLLLCFAIIICNTDFAHAQNAEKKALILKLMEVSGAHAQARTVLDNMLSLDDPNLQSLGKEFNERLSERLQTIDIKQLTDLYNPIYDKYYSEAQLIDLIKFYESDAGKHLLKNQQSILNEAFQVGAQWGEQLGVEVFEELQVERKERLKANLEGCEQFKEGEFFSFHPSGNKIFVSRSKGKQIETFLGDKHTYEVTWTAPCKYRIKEIGESDFQYKIFDVTIYEKTEKSYKYAAVSEGVDFVDDGEVFIVEE